MNKIISMKYTSSLTDLCEVNSSFDSGILRICYTGKNRNNSSISRAAIEKSLPTIYNCPIVCNYDRESDTFGGHDVEVVRDADGALRVVNRTQPVGVIPESSKIWFEEQEDEYGVLHEYLFAEALIWKRQEAYKKIREDGITEHSMEITVKAGCIDEGCYEINDFEFTAFTLIGVTPCFEGSALAMYTKDDLAQQYTEMMHDLKESFKTVTTSEEVDNINTENSTEGGEVVLDNITNENLNESTVTAEEVQTEVVTDVEPTVDLNEETSGVENETEEVDEQESFALTEAVVTEMLNAIDAVTIEREWGSCSRYIYTDCDFEAKMVYCWDVCDWLLYGFAYEMNGDNVVIDFDSKKRMKYVIAEFDEGDQPSPFASSFANMEQKLHDSAEWEAKYQSASDTIESLNEELGELRQFKTETENAIAKGERDDVLAQFEDLNGVEAFEALREDCMQYDVETLEEKCYAIRGRNGTAAKFNLETKTPKLKVETTDNSKEPYGGIFVKYGIKSN